MKNLYGMLAVIAVVLLSFSFTASNAQQSTYQKVYHILNTSCQGSGCHSSPGPQAGLDFSLSDSAVYAEIIGKVPVNPAAAAKGDKIIDPGYPYRSFLLRKVANCMEPDLALEVTEGNPMPYGGQPALADSSVELIRQWILMAAPKLGNVVDTALIADYYAGNGMPRMQIPAPPAPCEGFQIHLGPIFFHPGQENEYFKRYDLKNLDSIEVNRLDIHMNDESHHFILRKYVPGSAQSFSQALTLLDPLTAFDSNKDYVMAWQDDRDIKLPNGTAYSWDPNTSVDLNYHVHNYDTKDLACDVYLNVYTQPKGTALKEMKSALINEVFFGITKHDTTTKSYAEFHQTDVSLWSITSHTHKFGINYNVYLEKPNGSKGDQIFNGLYNTDYTFNQGFYSWEHPPTRRIEPLLYMGDPQSDGSGVKGLIHEAKWYNYSDTTVNFGFTTRDEMMIIYVQYVDGRYNIPAQGYINPACLPIPYTNPCSVTGVVDTSALQTGDSVAVGSGSTILSGSDSASASLGDTVTITSGGRTFTFVITGTGGPYVFNPGDTVLENSAGTVYLNGVAIGFDYGQANGIADPVVATVNGFNVYPNPFEGQTTIQYNLSQSGNVSVEVYDLVGKRVAQIVTNEKQTTGAHVYNFAPSNLNSGMYLVKLTVDGVSTIKKISVL